MTVAAVEPPTTKALRAPRPPVKLAPRSSGKVPAPKGRAAPRRSPKSPGLPSTLLASALRCLPEGVIIAPAHWSRQGLRIAFANDRICAMTGYSEKELVGQIHTFLHVDKTEIVRQRRWFRSAGGERTYSAEGYLTRRDGSALFAAWLLSPLCDGRGRVTHIVASYRDVTEKRHLQEALGHAQRIDAVGRLAGGVAHDFNNLLSVINGYSEILADRFSDDEKTSHDLAEIHGAGQKAAALTRQLLAFSRRQSIDPRVLDLNDVIRENAELLGRLLRPFNRLNLALAPNLCNVRVDPAALQQVLLNLTLNARDALSPGGHVTISTVRKHLRAGVAHRRVTEMPPGHYAQLSVSDSGSGMDEYVQAHLFEPFFTTKPQGQGTGLGLALVYGVIQQSGGFIFVHSAPGMGTTFDIFLPEVHEPTSARVPGMTSIPSTGGRESVLIIEEDDVLRKMIAGILTSDGYTVHSASASTKDLPLEQPSGKPFELVIVDSRDPTGKRLVQALALANPSVRLLTTSDRENVAQNEALNAESQSHLVKPFTLSTLLKVIRTLLDTPRQLTGGSTVDPLPFA